MKKILSYLVIMCFICSNGYAKDDDPNKVKTDAYSVDQELREILEKSSGLPVTEAKAASIESLGLEKRLFLVLKVNQSLARVNEQIQVSVKVYDNKLQITSLRRPSLSQNEISKADFGDANQYREEMGGLLFDVLEFKASICASKPGKYRIGPAIDSCSIVIKKPVSSGGFSYELQPVEIRSQDVEITVLPNDKKSF